MLHPSCDSTLKTTWSLVTGAAVEEQWPVEFVPLQGWQITPDDSRAVISSPQGTRYTFVQEIGVYSDTETINFRVRVSTRKRSYQATSPYDRLYAFLKTRGTVRPIRCTFPGTDVTKWRQARAAQITHSGGKFYEFSLSWVQDHNPG